MNKNKKLLGVLACASVLAGSFVSMGQYLNHDKNRLVSAAATNVNARSYGVDVSSYQNSNLSTLANNGGQFAIVKVSEGTSYRNPKAASQIKSAINNNMMPMAYHFATFGANSSAAISEANYAVQSAKSFGLPSGSYIACDWESGSGNNIYAGKNASATAILAFMNQIKASGYQPLLYSSASWLNNNINTNMILAKYPNSLWVASYASMGRIDTPNFNYFPSMNGVAIWQFTDNWRGLSVDGNISLLPLSMNKSASTSNQTSSAQTNIAHYARVKQSSQASAVKTTKTVMHSCAIYNSQGHRTNLPALRTYSKVTILGGVRSIKGRNYYQIGNNQYVLLSNIDGNTRKLKHNALVYNGKGQRVSGVPMLTRNSSITVYGGRIKIGNQSYYRINVDRYVKAGNIR